MAGVRWLGQRRRSGRQHPEIAHFWANCFIGPWATKQFSCVTKPFSAFGADIRKQRMVTTWTTKTAGNAGGQTGDSQMRTFSFILAFAVVLVGPSLTGSTESNLPGIGTFAYTGSPVVASAPHAIVVAAR
jgi:hypothetical protein